MNWIAIYCGISVLVFEPRSEEFLVIIKSVKIGGHTSQTRWYQNKLCPVPSTTKLCIACAVIDCIMFVSATNTSSLCAKCGLRPHTRQSHVSVPEKLWETSVLRKLQRVDRCVQPKFGDARNQISLVLAVCLKRCHD